MEDQLSQPGPHQPLSWQFFHVYQHSSFNTFSSSLPYKMPLSQENHLQMVISAYKTGKISSQLKAAEILGVPRSTLQDQLHGINS